MRAGIGVVIKKHRADEVLYSRSLEVPYGPGVNCLEYLAVIHAANWCVQNAVDMVWFKTDSLVVAKQMQGSFSVKDAAVRELHVELKSILSTGLEAWTFQHIDREINKEADRLAADATGRDAPKRKRKPEHIRTAECVRAEMTVIEEEIERLNKALVGLTSEWVELRTVEIDAA